MVLLVRSVLWVLLNNSIDPTPTVMPLIFDVEAPLLPFGSELRADPSWAVPLASTNGGNCAVFAGTTIGLKRVETEPKWVAERSSWPCPPWLGSGCKYCKILLSLVLSAAFMRSGTSLHGFSALRGLSGTRKSSRRSPSGLRSARSAVVLPDCSLFPWN